MQIKKWRADVLLVAGVLLVGCILGLVLLIGQKEGAKVQVRVAGEVVEVLELQENQTYQIQGVDGSTNLLVIKDKKAWIQEASCPDGLCVHMGKIDRDKQSVICLPNQVVVEIINETDSDEDSSGVDAVAGGKQ